MEVVLAHMDGEVMASLSAWSGVAFAVFVFIVAVMVVPSMNDPL